MKTPLDGKKILVTREKVQAKEFSTSIREAGGTPIEAPLITITCKQLSSRQLEQLTLQQYSWVFFTSANGVHCFFSQPLDVKKLFPHIQIAAVGSKTAEALKEYGFTADFIPPIYDAETMLNVFLKEHPVIGKWLLVRGNLSKMTIPEACDRHQIPYDTVVVYDTTHKESEAGHLKNMLREHHFDYITFTSPSTVDAFHARANDDVFKTIYANTPIICIGRTTKKRALQAGFQRVHRARIFTIEGMVQKMIDLEKERNV